MNTQQGKPNGSGQRDAREKFVRHNWKIKAGQCRVIAEGRPPTIMNTRDAIEYAQSKELDLVEVGYDPRSGISTAKVCEYGKYMYEMKRREKQAKKQDIKSDDKEELLVVCNFAGVDHDEIIGVPYAGKYKEIFNSDHTIYGGQGMLNIRVRKTLAKKADGYAQGIKIKMPARSVSVFRIDKEQE